MNPSPRMSGFLWICVLVLRSVIYCQLAEASFVLATKHDTRCRGIGNNHETKTRPLLDRHISGVFGVAGKSISCTASSNELPKDLPRRDDVLVALAAVRRACRVTARLQPDFEECDKDRSSTIQGAMNRIKKDLSPVTVADFAVQGLILKTLNESFPMDGFIAEEDSSSLQMDADLSSMVADAASATSADIMKSIDLGKSYDRWTHPSDRPSRVWVLDPIDGTRGFLRGKLSGGQYAIALALLQDGIPVIGILGCPNLPVEADSDNVEWENPADTDSKRGCIFVASRGGGCYQLSLDEQQSTTETSFPRRLHVTSESARATLDARFCIGVERYSDALGQCAGMASIIHGNASRALDTEGEIIRARRMDSQAKHGVIARGGAELYVRLPKPGYVEWIWDHAAGNVVIEEAGGQMTDTAGQPIDFSLGAQLSPEVKGVLMSSGGAFHTALTNAYAAVNAQTTTLR